MEGKVSLWTLESPMTTSRTGSLSALIATNMDIWLKNVNQRRKTEIPGNVSNVNEKNTLLRIVEEHNR